MTRLIFSALLALVFSLRAAIAQEDAAWIQVEAQPSLLQAEERVRDYAEFLPNVNGFSIRSGWYAVALGPYSEQQATAILRELRANGSVPRDSFVARSDAYRQQFWPVGANLLGTTFESDPPAGDAAEDVQTAEAETTEEQAPQAVVVTEPEPEPEETVREARQSERDLTPQEKKDLQIALQWAEFYTAAIDGAYGPGTRRAMAGWQEANGYEATGVLTTRQRAALLGQYNSVLEGMDLKLVRDATSGIEMKVPMGVVSFDAYEAPFARFAPSGDIPARVLFISQEGDRSRLYGLYDILQTLEVVPLDGPRERGRDDFTIVGENDEIISHTEVSLRGGEIKGFMLIWPSGDEERRSRVLAEMQDSFTRIDGVMPAALGASDTQSVDLLSGLVIRKPRLSRTGFYVTPTGTVLTTLEAVEGCSRVTLDGDMEARILQTDDAAGLALLEPSSRLAPMEVAELASTAPQLQSEVAVAGFSYEGVLGAPSMTFGKIVDLRGLNGEERLDRFALTALPGDAGGPVMDTSGAVIGMLLPRDAGGRQLPEEVSFSSDSGALQDMLSRAGIRPRTANGFAATLAPEDMTRKARGMTVLVSCWD
ncbi:serine protease [Primorskyibacter aestuariivivens]|uniref:serine protease n=1 Tax=Primorskyibacter aestuariivivens TaxID=1888912 RepID=UPI0022FFD584|nr:serine protease [Primorskyibacter aestuariivivens]MDA7427063.1 serine protease [Primorskyibacter aestuariivivens]